MVKKDQILNEVEKTLHTFDRDPILDTNPFLLTRIKVEMERRLQKRSARFARRINVKYVVIVVIVLINLVTVVHYFDSHSKYNLQEKLVSELKEDFQIDQPQNSF
jgi:hypothetical protein